MTSWAGSVLLITTVIAIAAKVVGVVVAPGARGVLGESMVNFIDTASGALAYTLTALLVALVCGASFELARARALNIVIRGSVVAVSGLIVALASPAVVERLNILPTLALAVITSIVGLAAGISVVRSPHTRAIGGILALLSICGLLRVVAWEASAIAFDRVSRSIHDVARGFSTAAVALQAIAALLAAAWIGTRATVSDAQARAATRGASAMSPLARWRGRILANAAILLAFVITWLGARNSDSPSTFEAILRTSLPAAVGLPAPFLLESISAFLVPASILLACAALLQPKQSPAVVAPLALALLSNGAFDIPIHALLITTAAQWAMLGMNEDRSVPVGLVLDADGLPRPLP